MAGYNIRNVKEFNVTGLQSLKTIDIGVHCIDISDGIFSITNCPLLTSLHLGVNSFNKYKTVALNQLTTLQTIIMDGFNFETAYEFNINSMCC